MPSSRRRADFRRSGVTGATRQLLCTPAHATGGVVRILVVDDHRNTLVSMSIGLRRGSGHMVGVAGNAGEALAALETTTFDCVVCDVRMPGVSGLELAQEIRRQWPMLAVVFMTAFQLNTAEKALARDLDAPCLLKPIRVEALLDTIHSVTQ